MKSFKRILLFKILILSIISNAFATPVIKFNKPKHQIIDEYLKLHKIFFKYACSGGAEQKYYELLRDYRGDGYFLPTIGEDRLDVNNIKASMGMIDEKIQWLEGLLADLRKREDFPPHQDKLQEIEKLIERLLSLKKSYDWNSKDGEKEQIAKKSKTLMQELRNKVFALLDTYPFLKGFNFPVDHFVLRKKYDLLKEGEKLSDQVMSNRIYLRRRILEDGAQDPDHTRSDKFFRTSLNSLALELQKDYEIIPEDLRYDFEYILSAIDKILSRGKSIQIKRLEEWHDRTLRTKEFYEKLVADYKAQKIGSEKNFEPLRTKSEAKFALRDYTLKKQAQVYKFWKDKSELLRALFSIETILFNEVGNVDARNGIERRDVTQVVINREKSDFYSSLEEDGQLYPYIKDLGKEEIQKYRWLNTLFKEGEFSFTYYFIPSAVKIFCPDMTRLGRFLRRENLKIALDLLENPEEDFEALRYFSRASMLGKIDMSDLWEDYLPIAERPGSLARRSRFLRRMYKKDHYTYLYTYKHSGRDYKVVKIRGRTYVILDHSERPRIYNYRNPHYFKYFKKKPKALSVN